MDVNSKVLQPEILSVDELTALLRQVVFFVSVL